MSLINDECDRLQSDEKCMNWLNQAQMNFTVKKAHIFYMFCSVEIEVNTENELMIIYTLHLWSIKANKQMVNLALLISQ